MTQPRDDEEGAQPQVNSPSRERGFCLVLLPLSPHGRALHVEFLWGNVKPIEPLRL